jgi:D-beta-D-heptose 7-phosphate kinase/D-beta-D-heptose 1-phosphate adenosyltransferase
MHHDFSNAKVLVVGDTMLDRYWNGHSERISPEAPVPVVGIQKEEERAGGAGNVALNVAALAGQSTLCSIIGADKAGKRLTQLLNEKNITTRFVHSNLPTITKLRVLSQHQQLLRMDFEERFHNQDKQNLIARFAEQIPECGAAVLSDYGKGAISDHQAIIHQANAYNIPILVDPKGQDFSKYAGATLITPNMNEFEAVVGHCPSEKLLIDKAKQLIETLNLQALLITRSEKGMMLIKRNGTVHTIPTQAKEVFDVTGAGDTVIAVMAMALSVDYPYEQAMQLANAAASVVVGKIGTATLNSEELHHALDSMSEIPTGIISEPKIIKAMHKAHLQGEKVVLTNGCFDIMHAGHVDYLKKAKQMGDRLIVAVNDDASVKQIKGNQRPIVSLNNRMAVLAALGCVDWVVAFSEHTPQRLIATLLPDVLVKGADYDLQAIAGAREVLDNGGEVKTIDLVADCSTTGIIETIKNQL